MRISLLFIFLLLSNLPGFSTVVRCSDPGYAGKQLAFYKPADPISGENTLCFKLNFDDTGNAKTEIKITQTLYSFCDFGIYRGMLYVEPGKSIDLKLPPFREKSFANQKNPYFTPVNFWFITETQDQLTDKTSKYEQKLNFLTDKHFNDLYFKQSKTTWDTVITQLNNEFPETSSKSFAYHKAIKKQLIEADIFRLRPEDYSAIFADAKPEYWTYQSFIELFEKTFDNQLSFTAKAIKGKEVNQAVISENTSTLLDFVKTKYKVSGEIGELVLLKLLHDGYYSGDFPRQTIKNMVSSNLFTNNSNAVIKEAANNINTKFSFLEKGSQAPVICLKNLNGEEVCTNSAKFKYIVFADAETAVCREHLKYLSRIDELFNKHLKIYVVLRETAPKQIQAFFTENPVHAEKMIDTDANFAKQYKIKSYPQCFLFDEKHRVVFTDTKPPLDGFEQQFGTWLRNELFMRQRNQAR